MKYSLYYCFRGFSAGFPIAWKPVAYCQNTSLRRCQIESDIIAKRHFGTVLTKIKEVK